MNRAHDGWRREVSGRVLLQMAAVVAHTCRRLGREAGPQGSNVPEIIDILAGDARATAAAWAMANSYVITSTAAVTLLGPCAAGGVR